MLRSVQATVFGMILVLVLAGCAPMLDGTAPPESAPTSEPVQESTAAEAEPTPEAAEESAAAEAEPTPEAAEESTAAETEPTSEPAAESTAVEAESTPPPPDSVPLSDPDWHAFGETYVDERVGFQLRYPAYWNLVDTSPDANANRTNYAVTINSWEEVEPEEATDGIPPGGSKVDILVRQTNVDNVEEAADQRREELLQGGPMVGDDVSIEDATALTLRGDLPAMRWTVTGGQMDAYEMITVLNGYTVVLAGLGEEQRFDEIVSTFQPN